MSATTESDKEPAQDPSTLYKVVRMVGVVACVLGGLWLMYQYSGSSAAGYREHLGLVRDAVRAEFAKTHPGGCAATKDLPTRRLVDTLHYIVGEKHVVLSAQRFEDILNAVYRRSGDRLVAADHGWRASAGPDHGNDGGAHQSDTAIATPPVPMLFRILFCPGFDYRIHRDTVDGDTALLFHGSYVKHFTSEKELETDTVYVALKERMKLLADHDELAAFVDMKQGGHAHSNSQEVHHTDLEKTRAWVQQRIPFARVHLDHLEVMCHTFFHEDMEHHRVDFHVKIGLIDLCAIKHP